MGKKVIILILAVIASATTAFSQTIKDKETLKRDSLKSNEQLSPENQATKPELLLDAEEKGFVLKEPTLDKKYTESSGLTPASPTKGISPYYFRFPELLKRNPTLTDFYNFEQMRLFGSFYMVGTGEKRPIRDWASLFPSTEPCGGFLLPAFSLKSAVYSANNTIPYYQ